MKNTGIICILFENKNTFWFLYFICLLLNLQMCQIILPDPVLYRLLHTRLDTETWCPPQMTHWRDKCATSDSWPINLCSDREREEEMVVVVMVLVVVDNLWKLNMIQWRCSVMNPLYILVWFFLFSFALPTHTFPFSFSLNYIICCDDTRLLFTFLAVPPSPPLL